MPAPSRGLGCKIEGAKVSTTDSFALLKLPPVGALEDISLEHHIPVVLGRPLILNQGNTSSCVAHAFAGGIHIMEHRAGLTFMGVSRLFMYYNARREEAPGDPNVADVGTYLRTCASGLRKFGACDEKHWEFNEGANAVNRRPDWQAMSVAHPRAGGRYVRIYDGGANRTQAIRAALAAGYPVAFGTAVPFSFLDDSGPDEIGKPAATDQIAGNHALLAIGCATMQGQTWFRVLNSWGSSWRDGGLCWMSAAYLEWDFTQDLHVIHGWKRITERV